MKNDPHWKIKRNITLISVLCLMGCSNASSGTGPSYHEGSLEPVIDLSEDAPVEETDNPDAEPETVVSEE